MWMAHIRVKAEKSATFPFGISECPFDENEYFKEENHEDKEQHKSRRYKVCGRPRFVARKSRRLNLHSECRVEDELRWQDLKRFSPCRSSHLYENANYLNRETDQLYPSGLIAIR